MMTGVVDVNGASLYFERAGQGSPVVFVSGGGTLDCRGWDDQFRSFATRHDVIRYDIRGIGKSTRPTQPFSHSADLRALLAFLHLEKPHIVGLSFGGAIALDLAVESPECVGRLVLAASGTSSDATGPDNLQALSMLASMARRDGIERVIQLILDTPSFIGQENIAGREKVHQIYLDNRDVFEADFPLVRLWQPAVRLVVNRLPTIQAPVLILEGEHDDPGYRAIGEKLLRIHG